MTNTTNTQHTSAPTLVNATWPCLAYSDARAAIGFLVGTLGFTEAAVYGDGDRVEHAELLWPHGGGVMLGSTGRGSLLDRHADNGTVYLVAPDDATVDALYEKVLASSGDSRATIVLELRDEDYGSHGFTCRDPQGVDWSIGTYRGHTP